MIRRICLYMVLILFGTAMICGGLFVINGLFLSNGEKPISGMTSHPAVSDDKAPAEIRMMAYNIAKGFIHKHGIRFEAKNTVLERMKRIAEIINTEQPHLVFLSEAVFECGPCPVNQVTFLAEATGMSAWVFGENYNFGLPFYRIVGGNAILSRFPVEAVANPALSGRQPFYVTTNNRRVLWAALKIGGERLLLASVHNDSFNAANNLIQTQQLLDYKGDRKAMLAGDFNSRPQEPSIQLIRKTGSFTASYEGHTFPSHQPDQKIDFIFAPSDWQLLRHRVIQTDASDHLPIVSTFKLPEIP